MKYNAYYYSYDLNRKNVLVYGKEKIDLFSLEFVIKPNINLADTVIIDENFNIETVPYEDFIFERYCDIIFDKHDDNVNLFVNEHQEIFSMFREFNEKIHNIQNIITDFYEQVDCSNLNTEEDFLSKKEIIEQFFENYLTTLSDKFNFNWEKVEEDYTIPEKEQSIQEYIQEVKTQIETELTQIIEEETEVITEEATSEDGTNRNRRGRSTNEETTN